jgi:phosphate:Na+ symporter
MTSGRNAKRTALIHLFFNISGVVIFLFIEAVIWLASGKSVTYGSIFTKMFPGAPQTQLAMFHTFFNIATVLVMLPLTQMLVNIVCSLVPDDKHPIDPNAPHLYYLDDNMLTAPPMALQQTKKEIVHMADLAMENFNLSLDIICTLDFSEVGKFNIREEELNFLNQAIVDFVVKLSEKPQLSQKDHIYLSTTFRSVRDLERIGDYAENIVEYAESLRGLNHTFSQDAIDEIRQVQTRISDLYERIMVAYEEESLDALEEANVIEEEIDDITKAMEDNHIKRLEAGICGADVGAQYLSLSSNAERVADHLINVGKTIRKITN